MHCNIDKYFILAVLHILASLLSKPNFQALRCRVQLLQRAAWQGPAKMSYFSCELITHDHCTEPEMLQSSRNKRSIMYI